MCARSLATWSNGGKPTESGVVRMCWFRPYKQEVGGSSPSPPIPTKGLLSDYFSNEAPAPPELPRLLLGCTRGASGSERVPGGPGKRGGSDVRRKDRRPSGARAWAHPELGSAIAKERRPVTPEVAGSSPVAPASHSETKFVICEAFSHGRTEAPATASHRRSARDSKTVTKTVTTNGPLRGAWPTASDLGAWLDGQCLEAAGSRRFAAATRASQEPATRHRHCMRDGNGGFAGALQGILRAKRRQSWCSAS